VSICDVCDAAVPAPLAVYQAGDLLNAYIESLEPNNVYVSLRPSRTGAVAKTQPSPTATAADKGAGKKQKQEHKQEAAGAGEEAADSGEAFPEIRSIRDLSAGQLVSGYVKSTNAAGCFVQLGRTVTARVIISELSDRFIKDVKGAYPAGRLVTGRVIHLDTAKEQVSMSLKRSVVLGKNRLLFSDVAIGQVAQRSQPVT
jgi:transcriptional accessory protein Tex/SPT6